MPDDRHSSLVHPQRRLGAACRTRLTFSATQSLLVSLYLSAHTIKSHINRIFVKTGSADRAAAVCYALDQHLA
jgi:hypothetical protein